MNLLSGGVIAGSLALVSGALIAAHHPALGAFIGDPQTATEVTAVATGLLAFAAGAMKGIRSDASKKS
jgi:hypothetical protein